ncbi:hypothetical protein PMIN01_00574 [Paraphaeosphaeria minitans]|uniref:Uncharacterized protein n=1 Tax=Paraphaeosphaeria minitans TaxID=565426 RepID=A0A9P6GUZ4_9PLEO|nr:hypothetical protein PMIN01_00574 [Paraphaeosphaeria minitans]
MPWMPWMPARLWPRPRLALASAVSPDAAWPAGLLACQKQRALMRAVCPVALRRGAAHGVFSQRAAAVWCYAGVFAMLHLPTYLPTYCVLCRGRLRTRLDHQMAAGRSSGGPAALRADPGRASPCSGLTCLVFRPREGMTIGRARSRRRRGPTALDMSTSEGRKIDGNRGCGPGRGARPEVPCETMPRCEPQLPCEGVGQEETRARIVNKQMSQVAGLREELSSGSRIAASACASCILRPTPPK